jgi:conjugative relaxase-like TrwC/TraI family protein
MIRITKQNSADAANRLYAPAAYYNEGRGIIGSWGGKGAARLRLAGTVRKLLFHRLCHNENPKTRQRLTVRTSSRRTVAYDVRFSVSKSVSLLYGLTGDNAILDAFRAAVDETMREMETEMKTRVRKSGADTNRTTGNMVWAEFIHMTACPVDGVCDPQLHAYLCVFNATWDEKEECWKAGWFRDLKRDAPYFQAAFRVRLANRLQDLGFGVERNRDDFEIAGVPLDVLKRFSRRTAVVERVARQRRLTDPRWKAELGAKTREKAMLPLSLEFQWKEWRTRLSLAEREALALVCRRKTPYARQGNGEAMAVDQAVEHCFVRHEVVPERTLITEALKRGIGSVTVEGVTREVRRRPFVWSELAGRTMVAQRRNRV